MGGADALARRLENSVPQPKGQSKFPFRPAMYFCGKHCGTEKTLWTFFAYSDACRPETGSAKSLIN
jgi:hypothetical protein